MAFDERPRAGVARQRRSASQWRREKPTGWPRSPRYGAPRYRRPDAIASRKRANRRRRDPRHVGERDDPAIGVRARRDAAREARPIPSSALAHDTTRSRRAQPRGKPDVARPHDGDRIGNASTQMPAAATPSGVPRSAVAPGIGASSLSPPKRAPRPAASRMPTMRIGCAMTPSAAALAGADASRYSGSKPELAVLDGDQHPRALVHAVVIRRRHVEHALASDDFALLLQRVAQRRCETPRCRACRLSAPTGIARSSSNPESHVLAPNVAGFVPNCFSYAAM